MFFNSVDDLMASADVAQYEKFFTYDFVINFHQTQSMINFWYCFSWYFC